MDISKHAVPSRDRWQAVLIHTMVCHLTGFNTRKFHFDPTCLKETVADEKSDYLCVSWRGQKM